jgi:two-component system, LytTR family, response regulator LytT
MNVAIIEDEEPARRQLCRFLRRYDPAVEVVAELDSVASTAAWLSGDPPVDLLLCDVQLLDGTVFGAFDGGAPACPIIFTTAHDDYLLQAFEAGGVGYLLKPIEYPALEAVLRRTERLGRSLGRLDPELIETMRQAIRQPTRRRLVVRRRDGIYLLPSDQIAYVRLRNELASAFDGAGTEYPLTESLKQLEAQLPPDEFFRLNRNEIVSARFIRRLVPHGDRLLVQLRGLDAELLSSAARTPALRRWLEG